MMQREAAALLHALAVDLVRRDAAGDQRGRDRLVDWRFALLRGEWPDVAIVACASCGRVVEGPPSRRTCSQLCRARLHQQRRRPRGRPRHHRRARRVGCACDACHRCRARERMRRVWQERRSGQRPPARKRCDTWSVEEKARLAALAGVVEAPEIARVLSAEFGCRRTVYAVRARARLLGLSLWIEGYSLRQLADLFGVSRSGIQRHWVAAGLLRLTRRRGRLGRGGLGAWYVSEPEVETFIRQHPWAYDWRRMRRGHRLAALAEVAQRADPWLERAEALRALGVGKARFVAAMRGGLIPYRRRHTVRGAAYGAVVVRGRDLAEIADALGPVRQGRPGRRGLGEGAGRP